MGPTQDASKEALARSRFLASMGHTLRSPLNAILGFADILQEGVAGPLSERQRQYVDRIVEAGERQLEIIDNLIELSRFHSGDAPFQPEPISVERLLERTVSRFKKRADASGVAVLLDSDTGSRKVFVDPDGVERALGNLLSNAIRHMDEGGVVRIAASNGSPDGEECDPDSVTICVADSGEGVDKAVQEFLFDDLDSGEASTARRQQRSGTGLPLARRLLEREGGSIHLVSSGEQGEGSRFRIKLPLWKEDAP